MFDQGLWIGLWLASQDFERSKVSADIRRIERRARESPHRAIDGLDCPGTEGAVVEIGPKHAHRGCERCCAERGLSPTRHLRIEPGGLDGIGSCRPFPSHQEIAAALADGA